jgi:hypothetical protein
MSSHDSRGHFAWIFAKSDHLFTFVKPSTVVEPKNASGDFPDRGQQSNCCCVHANVIGPLVSARIEKTRELAAWGDRSDIASLGAVAKSTSVSEIVCF